MEIAHEDAEEGATQPIVDPGNECLLIFPLLVSGDDVRFAADNRRNEPRNVFRFVLKISRVENENRPARVKKTGAQRVSDSAARLMPHGAEKGIARLQLAKNFPGVIDRPVIDDDDLISAARVVKCGLSLLHEK